MATEHEILESFLSIETGIKEMLYTDSAHDNEKINILVANSVAVLESVVVDLGRIADALEAIAEKALE